MLEQLTLKNVQAHESFVLNLDRITTIVGPSDKGKTSILRSLRWLALNTAPAGLMRWGASHTDAILVVDRRTVARIRSKSANSYLLDGKRFDAVRSDVPEEIAKLLNLGSENFARQMDPPFWFTETAGQVSRELNRIVNLEVIDRALADAAKNTRDAKSEAVSCEWRKAEAEALAMAHEWVGDMDEELEELEKIEEEKTRLHQEISDLEGEIAEAETLMDDIVNSTVFRRDSMMIIRFFAERDQLDTIIRSVEELIGEAEKHRSIGWRLLERMKQGQQRLAKEKVCPLCNQPIARSLPSA